MSEYSMDDLLYLMSRLRDPDSGCPWDLQQSAVDIINYSIEEVYELADAIESSQNDDIRDELGDVLFQVVFLSRLSEENNQFDFSAVVNGLCDKLIRRHPHVFPTGELYFNSNVSDQQQASKMFDQNQVALNWDQIKKQERQKKNRAALFDDVPLALPGIQRAIKLQKRAAKIGLDWPDVTGPIKKLYEEFSELEQAVNEKNSNQEHIREELGDLFFTLANVARKLGIDAEQALRMANNKFERRCQNVDNQLSENEVYDSKYLEQLWESAKVDETR